MKTRTLFLSALLAIISFTNFGQQSFIDHQSSIIFNFDYLQSHQSQSSSHDKWDQTSMNTSNSVTELLSFTRQSALLSGDRYIASEIPVYTTNEFSNTISENSLEVEKWMTVLFTNNIETNTGSKKKLSAAGKIKETAPAERSMIRKVKAHSIAKHEWKVNETPLEVEAWMTVLFL